MTDGYGCHVHFLPGAEEEVTQLSYKVNGLLIVVPRDGVIPSGIPLADARTMMGQLGRVVAQGMTLNYIPAVAPVGKLLKRGAGNKG